MNRREFLAAGSALAAAAWGRPGLSFEPGKKKPVKFEKIEAKVPVLQVTPEDGYYVHSYYDVCPFSPSGRYLAATRIPYQDRIPVIGDRADVCLIDLQDRTIQTVYTTKCWGFQTGSNAQWGATDRHLYTNDVFDGKAVCVRLDLDKGTTTHFDGPMYHIAPDESAVVGFPLELLDVTQRGYGVPPKDPDDPKKLPVGASKTEGLWRTDLNSGKTNLLVSLADVAAKVPEPAPEKGGTYYFWHSKFNRQGTRIMQVLRCLLPSGAGDVNTMVFSFKPDGSDIRYAPGVPIWGAKGGHPNWHPDGVHLIRVLRLDGKTPRLCQFRYDGTEAKSLSDKILGGGHPTFDKAGKWIVTDTFHEDPHRVSILMIDMQAERETAVCTLPTLQRGEKLEYQAHRLDGHPAWDRDTKSVCFQAAPKGARQLFIADMSGFMKS
ncbi:MAG: hypothetical protein AB7K24_11640 [Gemmataceae bacterium]